MATDDNFADRLRRVRRMLGKRTQGWLARRLGVSASSLAHWEQEFSQPGPITRRAIEPVLGKLEERGKARQERIRLKRIARAQAEGRTEKTPAGGHV